MTADNFVRIRAFQEVPGLHSGITAVRTQSPQSPNVHVWVTCPQRIDNPSVSSMNKERFEGAVAKRRESG